MHAHVNTNTQTRGRNLGSAAFLQPQHFRGCSRRFEAGLYVDTGSCCLTLAGLNWLCRLGWTPSSQRPVYLCLQTAGIKGMHHTQLRGVGVGENTDNRQTLGCALVGETRQQQLPAGSSGTPDQRPSTISAEMTAIVAQSSKGDQLPTGPAHPHGPDYLLECVPSQL